MSLTVQLRRHPSSRKHQIAVSISTRLLSAPSVGVWRAGSSRRSLRCPGRDGYHLSDRHHRTCHVRGRAAVTSRPHPGGNSHDSTSAAGVQRSPARRLCRYLRPTARRSRPETTRDEAGRILWCPLTFRTAIPGAETGVSSVSARPVRLHLSSSVSVSVRPSVCLSVCQAVVGSCDRPEVGSIVSGFRAVFSGPTGPAEPTGEGRGGSGRVSPGIQMHRKAPLSSRHVPSFWHGFESHSLMLISHLRTRRTISERQLRASMV